MQHNHVWLSTAHCILILFCY